MEKLFSCLYGSMLYGTNTPESDRDVKHIVLPGMDDLLLGRSPKNVVKKTNKRDGKNNAEDVDEEFIPLQVFAKDFLNGQTYALELAYAVKFSGAEQKIFDYPRFEEFCSELRAQFLTSDIHAMVSYAGSQARLYSQKGDRLNAAKAVEKILSLFPGDRSMYDFEDQFTTLEQSLESDYPELVKITTHDLGNGHVGLCLKVLDKILMYSNSFENNLATVNALIKKYGDRAQAAAETAADWKALMHATRIADQGIALLALKGLVFPYEPQYVKKLLQIRRGELPYEQVVAEFNSTVSVLKDLCEHSTLPKNTPELRAKLDAWLLGWLRRFYFY